MDLKALILSGGHGTRLRPITYSQQKQLIPVANRPILFYAIDDCVEAGVNEIGIITGPNREQVEDTVMEAAKTGEWPDVDFQFIHQGDPKGLAHTIMVAQDEGFLTQDDPFVMYLGDNILSGGISDMAEDFRQDVQEIGLEDLGAHIMLNPVDEPSQFGLAEVDDEGNIENLVEKPDDPPSNLAVIGVYFFGPRVLEATDHLEPSWRGEYEILDAIEWLLGEELEVKAGHVQGWWKDTGKPFDVLGANRLVLDGIRPGSQVPERDEIEGDIVGRVRIEEGAEIDSKSTVKGPAVIGEDSVISDSYVGPYTSIGPGCRLEEAEVEDSIVLEGTTIEKVQRIEESLFGRDVHLGSTDGRPRGRRFVVGDQSTIEL